MCEVSVLSFFFSHRTSEFMNGKSFFFMVFASQGNDCLESTTILIGTALNLSFFFY